MKIKTNFIMILSLSLLLAACDTRPQYKNYSGSDASCIQGDFANFLKVFFAGESYVGIEEIDGLSSDAGVKGKACVTPGKHKVGLTAIKENITLNKLIEMNFIAGKNYKITAEKDGIHFEFTILDVTDGNKSVIGKFDGYISQVIQPITPVFIRVQR
ncbi:MAG: hypothetical protein WCL30_00240 [Pseudomonadota bacterium]